MIDDVADRKPKSDDFTVSFAQRLRKARSDRGWTQLELAERLGIVRVMITNYERGFHHPPLPTLVKLARTLGVSNDYLLNGNDASTELQDRELVDFVAKVDKLDYRARDTLKEMILALLARHGAPGENVRSRPTPRR